MAKKYDSLGVMIDLSRNGVMTLPSMKQFLATIAKMGYNTVFLYMEDTYEVEGEPYFGYMRSRYSIEEMKELDDYCTSIGMEAIPCIQTLAHMRTFFKWAQVPVDCGDILLVEEERTYELISNMFKTLSKCFKSKRIHIGMDEAHMLGKGVYCDKHGYRTPNEIIKDHLNKICEIAKEYDYTLLLWSDMFFRTWNNGDYYINEVKKVPTEVINAVPDSVAPVYWDYYSRTEEKFDTMIKMHKQFKGETWFAGGAWCWVGFAPLNQFSINNMSLALSACRKNKVKNIFMTMWGDDGMECSHFSQFPALLYVAECAKGNFDEEKIKAKFQRMFGISYDDYMKTDLPNQIGKKKLMRWESPSKYMLYSDPLLGFLDYTVALGDGAAFASHAKELRAVAKKTRKYGYVFSTLAALCDVMEIKYELGLKTRNAYKSGDKAELARLAKEDYVETAKRVKAFHRAFEKQWYIDNKPSGMEVHDGRLGALVQRLDSCKRRILAYVNGELEALEELDGELLPFGPFDDKEQGEPIIYNCYGRICTSNQFTHFMQ
jgi:hypothetical protein